MVDLGSYLLGAVQLALVVVPLAFSAYRLRQRLLPTWEGAPARLVESITFVALLLWISEILGTFGLFYAGTLIAAFVLLGLAMWFLPGGGTVGGTPPEEALATGRGGGSPAVTGPAGQAALSLEEIQRVWPAVLQKLGETAPALAATFDGARPVSYDDGALQVGFPAEMTFNKKKADSPERRDTLAAAFAAVTGVGLRPTYVMLEGEAPPDTPAPGSEDVDEDELLERLKSEFNAEEVS
jgi:hypothetical protein